MLQLIFIKPSDRISLESFDVTKSTCCCLYPGGDFHMKGVGMLVVSLRDVNFGFWSHLGCSEQSIIILSRKVLF